VGKGRSFILFQPPLDCFQSRHLPNSSPIVNPYSPDVMAGQKCRSQMFAAVHSLSWQRCGDQPGFPFISRDKSWYLILIRGGLCSLGPGWRGCFWGQELSGWSRSMVGLFVICQEEDPFTQAALAWNYLPQVACQLVSACIQETVAGSSITCAFAHWADCRDCDKLNLGWEVYFA